MGDSIDIINEITRIEPTSPLLITSGDEAERTPTHTKSKEGKPALGRQI